ncbi:unnamed protein product [Durusdinium trenchii]|uniref:Uncharacterized protein n=1 Tax=Durusdinium trenchii TaxID=1381693 RepID=A0ABP0K0N1_9DINO
MGTSAIRACCESLSQASAGAGSRRLEDLLIEVDEARKENQRLNRHLQQMRHELKVGGERHRGHSRMQAHVSESKLPGEETRHLQHILSQLQVGRPRVSLSQYQSLQQQVHELQRANQAYADPVTEPSFRSVPSSYSHRGSLYASGRQTPMTGAPSITLWSSAVQRTSVGDRFCLHGRRLQATLAGHATRE